MTARKLTLTPAADAVLASIRESGIKGSMGRYVSGIVAHRATVGAHALDALRRSGLTWAEIRTVVAGLSSLCTLGAAGESFVCAELLDDCPAQLRGADAVLLRVLALELAAQVACGDTALAARVGGGGR